MSVLKNITEWLLAKTQPNILELGTHSFRKAIGKYSAEGFKITELKSVPAPGDLVFSSQIGEFAFEHDSFKNTLSELFEANQFKEKHVSVVIPDQAFHLGTFFVPTVALKTGFQPLLEREIQKTSALSFNEYETRYEFGRKQGNKTSIHFCALPTGTLREIKSLCDSAGLIPLSVQPSFVGVASLYRKQLGNSHHNVTLIHIGNETSTAVILNKDGIKQIQIIDIGMLNFKTTLVESLSISMEEAERIIENDIVLLEDPTSEAQFEIDAYRALETLFADFLKKIYGFMLLYSNENPKEVGFAKIVLSGGGAKFKNIGKLVFANLGISTALFADEIANSVLDASFPEGDCANSFSGVLGNIQLEPWQVKTYERIVAAA